MRRLLAITTLSSLLVLPSLWAWAAPGDLDETFDGDGIVLTDVNGSDRATGVALDNDGRIVVVGYDGNQDAIVARYAADGSLDTTFGVDGLVIDDLSGSLNHLSAIAVDSEGNIVVAGDTSSDAIVARYLPNGSRDVGFSGDGVVVGGVGNPSNVTSVAIDSEDRIVIGGTGGFGSGWQWFVARYLPDGTPDPAFDGDGVLVPGGSAQFSGAVTVDADDRVILAGTQNSGSFVLRFTEGGIPDTTFSDDGSVDIGVATDSVYAVSTDPDGAIVVAGNVGDDPFVARVADDGTVDTGFSGDGVATVDGGPYFATFSSVTTDSSGNVVAVGYLGNDLGGFMFELIDLDLFMVRFDADGTVDPAFWDEGIYQHTLGQYDDSGAGVVFDADGNMIVAGYATAGNRDTLLLRFEGSGVPPSSTTSSSSTSSSASSSSTSSTSSSSTSSSSTSTTVPSTTTTTVPEEPEEPEIPVFTDDDGSVFAADIAKLAQRGVTRGCNPPENTRFCPDEPVSRGQMAAFLIRILGEPDGMSDEDVFSDDNGSVFENDIEALAAWSVTRGCNSPENTRFCPEGQVSRGQMAAFLARALDLPATSDDFFSDDNGSVFETDINRVAAAGVARGCNPPANDAFCPDQPVTRGQMAAFLVRGFFTD